MAVPAQAHTEKLSTGVPGLDTVLDGGLPANQMHLVLGPPGAGKTTLGMQFLIEGASRGERVLYVTLAESEAELHQVARSHGWSLDNVTIREMSPSEEHLSQEHQYTILYPGEVEFSETLQVVLKEVDEFRPTRVVFDSLAEVRLLARDTVRYRHQILALKRFFAGRNCTVILLDNAENREQSLESVAHGVLLLEQATPDYGSIRRRLHVVKLRGTTYRGGHHDFDLQTGGLVVYPRLVAAEHRDEERSIEVMESGVPELDQLLGGGLRRGTSALIIGPAGSGKSTLGAQYAAAAAARGQRSSIYIFEELRQTYIDRSEGLGIDIQRWVDEGMIDIEQLDPAQLSPGAFIQRVGNAVEQDGVRLVVIDSLNGYLNAMVEERMVIVQLHELLTYLGQRGVLTILTMAQHGLVGDGIHPPLDVSYLADSVILIRYFEAHGAVRQALSVVKKRIGRHERSIRELSLGEGVHVGEVLRDFDGVMTGVPRFTGNQTRLAERGD